MITDKTVQQQLIAQGNAQGFITYDDILKLVPSAEQNIESLEDLMDELTQAGIVILPEAPKPEPAPEIPDDEEPVEILEGPDDEELEDLGTLEFDLIQDAGYQAAIDTDDVVGLYLKEAGRVPLLNAEEE